MTADAPRGGHGRRARAITAAGWLVLLLGLLLWSRVPGGGDGAADLVDAASPAQVLRDGPPAAPPLPGSASSAESSAAPVSIAVDSVGVRAPVIRRGLDGDGAVRSPPYANPEVVGWYRRSAEPGAAGVSVFVGHMDTASDPAVFYRLNDVRPGDEVEVVRADGATAVFTVERVEMFAKDDFDARRVYGQHKRGRAEIRLLTCGGLYEPLKKRYTGNWVVSGYLTGP